MHRAPPLPTPWGEHRAERAPLAGDDVIVAPSTIGHVDHPASQRAFARDRSRATLAWATGVNDGGSRWADQYPSQLADDQLVVRVATQGRSSHVDQEIVAGRLAHPTGEFPLRSR